MTHNCPFQLECSNTIKNNKTATGVCFDGLEKLAIPFKLVECLTCDNALVIRISGG